MRRRWTKRIIAALAAGFVLNVLVAWGIVIFIPMPQFTATSKSIASGWAGSTPESLDEPDSVHVTRHAGTSHWPGPYS